MTSQNYSVQDILSDLEKLQEWESSAAAAAASSSVNPSLHPILELGRSISNPFHSDSSRLASSLDDEAQSQSQSRFRQLLDSFDSKKSSTSTSSSAAESSIISDHVQLASLFIQSAQKALQLDQSQPFFETQQPQDQQFNPSQDSSRIETLHGTIAKLQARAEDKEKSLLAALQALEAQT